MDAPRDAPEKRPSVMSATDLSSFIPASALVGLSISAHTGAAHRAFVSDDHHISRLDAAVVNGVDGAFLTVKHPRGTAVHQHLGSNRAALHHAAVLRNVAPTSRRCRRLAVRVVRGTDGVCIAVLRACNVLAHSFARHRGQTCIQQAQPGQLRHDSGHAAAAYRSSICVGPAGARWQKLGTFALISLKVSRLIGTSASLAMASRCKTLLELQPSAYPWPVHF